MGRGAQWTHISQKEIGIWNFQWQPSFFEFSQDHEDPHSWHFWCPTSLATLGFSHRCGGQFYCYQLYLVASYPKHRGTEFLSASCLQAFSESVKSAWLLESLPGNVRELMCLRSILIDRVWGLNECPSPLSFKWTVLGSSLSSPLELPGPTAGTPVMQPYWSSSFPWFLTSFSHLGLPPK